jgi:3-oxoacyl-[acyl-carrier protein] reductase
MDINLRSFFVICKESVRLMKKQNYGRIVNVSSIAGRNKSIVSGVHYTSSKYGVIGLTKQLANEVSQYNILVNCVCPSQTMTEMLSESMTNEEISALESKIPVRRIATTTEQALPVLFLCSNAASYIAGATIDINGGQL